MSGLFIKILNMSIAASWLILAVFLLRRLLKKAPKWVNVLLWGIVALRLLCPVSIESTLSLIPGAETIPADILLQVQPMINSGLSLLNSTINDFILQSAAPAAEASANPLQITFFVLSVIWIAGLCLMLAYSLLSYLRLRHRLNTAIRLKDNIYQSENIAAPFILGIIRPRIYLPFEQEESLEYVLAHEQAHLSRRDQLWKPLGFLLLSIYWFNPLMWAAYILLCRDIESACDEKVIRHLDREQRVNYSEALLNCSISRKSLAACPLAFGEVGVKSRIKNVLNYQKPAFWLIVIAVLVCIAVSVCFLTNPPGEEPQLTLDKVIALSQKGDRLGWEDFAAYEGRDIGSGLYIMRYEIDGWFYLLAGGVPGEGNEPLYVLLCCGSYENEATQASIELRSKDISKEAVRDFIDAHQYRYPIRTESNSEANTEVTTEVNTEIGKEIGDEFSYPILILDKTSTADNESSIKEPEESITDIDEAIRLAVLQHYADDLTTGLLRCESHKILATASGTPREESTTSATTVFAIALYREYNLSMSSGSYVSRVSPCIITFTVSDKGEYTAAKYWEPSEEKFAAEINERFPEEIVKEAIDAQSYEAELGESCEEQLKACLDFLNKQLPTQ